MDNNDDKKLKLEDKVPVLKYTIDRYDHYYSTINTKSNLQLTLNTFLLGGIISGFYYIKDTLGCGCDIVCLVWLALSFCILSIGFCLWATIPYLSKQSDSINGSVIYFGNVANMSFSSFNEMYNIMTSEKIYEDLLQQTHLLAIGLQKKFYRLKIATYLLGGCFLFIIIIGFKILK